MPKRDDLKKILIIGAGPIVIGQACEFDYSGTQACKALRDEGYEVVLVNSNPATIMTDPDVADRTYIEPITLDTLEEIVRKERPDAILPTMGGQTALNMAIALHDAGILKTFDVELIGANYASIKRAEDREAFKKVIEEAGLEYIQSSIASSLDDALVIVERTGFPAIIRPSFTLGGLGGNIAYHPEEFEQFVKAGLASSPTHEVLIEESAIGWKEFELEVMRDKHDNVVIICSIENLDPMGVHTGDSITVAPVQTLTDKEYQLMRDGAIRIIRGVGVDSGGSNVQFALNSANGEMRVIEMNPRVSRSSALASKATGYPIAKVAAKLAIGLCLDEIQNDITSVTPASFEPTIDYVVVKIPRFAFEKFPLIDPTLSLQMKSVGEVMAIGRNFREALLKALRSLEINREGIEPAHQIEQGIESLKALLARPTLSRISQITDAIRLGVSLEEIHQITRIDPWFLHQFQEIVGLEAKLNHCGDLANDLDLLSEAKRAGYSDRQIAGITSQSPAEIAELRKNSGIVPVYKRVDTCGAEFEAHTPYLYSTYEDECESEPSGREKVIILGSGPNRIGQGVEFDYCCVHAVFALKDLGYESIMVNCNPETVSTDYDTSDRLYFEPLCHEDVLHIIEKENPLGVVVQFGGQTPLKLAVPLQKEGIPILGTAPDAIDRAEDRERFDLLVRKLGLKQPLNGMARSVAEAEAVAKDIGYPIIVRPSYVLGGRAMEIIYDLESLRKYMLHAVDASPDHPILVDQYLEDATELDVDAVADGEAVFVAGVMEHIEQAGVHSGDSACSLPPFSVDESVIRTIRQQTSVIAKELGVIGLVNIQFAVKEGEVYIIEVNPRGSRTVPFVSKTIGLPLAKIAMKVIMGESLAEQGISEKVFDHVAVKEAVFPFKRFRTDSILGPEMKSTGEVMGIDRDFGRAFAKAETAADNHLPKAGRVFISVKDRDKAEASLIARKLVAMGFQLLATLGTASYLKKQGLDVILLKKIQEGRPNIIDHLEKHEVHLVINTVGDKKSEDDSGAIRHKVLEDGIPYFTTIAGGRAATRGIEALLKDQLSVKAIQDYYNK